MECVPPLDGMAGCSKSAPVPKLMDLVVKVLALTVLPPPHAAFTARWSRSSRTPTGIELYGTFHQKEAAERVGNASDSSARQKTRPTFRGLDAWGIRDDESPELHPNDEAPQRIRCGASSLLFVTYRRPEIDLASVSLLADWSTELSDLLTIDQNGGGDEATGAFHTEDRVATGRDGDEPFRYSTPFEDNDHVIGDAKARRDEGDNSEDAVVRDETNLPSAPARRTQGAGGGFGRTVGREAGVLHCEGCV
jgi:hypothetical protein